MSVYNKLLENTIECIADGIIGLSKSGKITVFNTKAESLFGLKRDDIFGKKYDLLKDQSLVKYIDAIFLKDEPASEEHLLSMEDERYFSVFLVPLVKDVKLDGLIIIMREVTDLKNIEKAMIHFVGNVSHEFRTPLTSIKGFVETLLEGALGDEEVCRRFLQVINEETNRLVRLTVSLLDVTSSLGGEKKKQLKYELVNIQEIIDNALGMLRPFASKYSLEFEVDCPSDIPIIFLDKDMIKQVFINLIDNAIKYTGILGKGRITITVCNKYRELEITVADTGVGIPEKDIDKIFHRFYRVDRGYSQEVGGTGIGLAITQDIVETFGGKIWVNSKVGEGSRFTFTLSKNLPLT